MSRLIAFLCVVLFVGCDRAAPTTPMTMPLSGDFPEPVRTADVSLLFVGNSHTTLHGLPDRVCEMVRFLKPGKTVAPRIIPVAHLEALATEPRGQQELDAQPWTAVILQAQKISASGKFDHPRDDGIAFAKRAKEKGAKVLFFAEWGVKNDPTSGPRHETIYREMATQAGVEVAAVGRAWDMALAERPEFVLHDVDGNHQSHLGAFLTACVLTACITGEDATKLATFPDESIPAVDRAFLASIAAKSIAK